MNEAIKQMINQARHNMEETIGLQHLRFQYEYWKGRCEALEDALKAIKIESEWSTRA